MRSAYMFKLSVVVPLLLIFGMVFADPASAGGSCRIVNISVKKEGDFTKVAVYGDKPFEFVHSTEEANAGKPYRVIIDCKDAIFDLPQRNFREGLPPGMITAVRTSQFQVVPQKIVRVVVDLKAPAAYKVADSESENEADIAILTKQDRDFPMWVAVLEEKGQPGGRRTSTQKKQLSARSGESAAGKDQGSEISKAPGSATEVPVDPKASGKRAPKLVRKKDAYRRAVSYADTGETGGSKVTVSSQAGSRDRRERPTTSLGRGQKTHQVLSLRRRISRSPVPLGPFPEGWSPETASAQKRSLTKAGTEKKKGVPHKEEGLVEKGIGKILGPESVSAGETEVLSESLMMTAGSQTSALGLAPERKMIIYKPETPRDPFTPITERGEMTFGVAPLPLFENLTLVGVLKDRRGNRALLEDDLGYGYILMGGDKIKNGYLIKVEDDRAFFHVEEYGGYQIMVLELKREY